MYLIKLLFHNFESHLKSLNCSGCERDFKKMNALLALNIKNMKGKDTLLHLDSIKETDYIQS